MQRRGAAKPSIEGVMIHVVDLAIMIVSGTAVSGTAADTAAAHDAPPDDARPVGMPQEFQSEPSASGSSSRNILS